jgi:uncharacterized membrane protein
MEKNSMRKLIISAIAMAPVLVTAVANAQLFVQKLILAIALTFALAAGTVTVLTVQPQSAMACVGNDC